jgi:putative permease
MKKVQAIRLALFIFFLLTTIIFGILFPRLSLPFGFSYIIYLMVNPFTMKVTTGSRAQRVLYSALMALLLTSILIPIGASLYSADTNFGEFYGQLPEFKKLLQEKFFEFKVIVFEKFGYNIKIDPVKYVVSYFETAGSMILSQIPAYLSSILEWFLLVPLFLYFFFRESSKFSKWFMSGIPNSIFEKTYVLFSEFNKKFGEYIIAKFVEATILGTLVTIGLFSIKFPYALPLGLFAGLTNILPYIGPVLGFVPALMIALLSKDPNISILGVSLVFGISNLIDMILVFPLLVSKIVNLHPIIVFVSIIVGSQLGGVVGMIVIIPFIAFFKILFFEIYKDLSVHL